MRAMMEVNQHLNESIAALSEDVKDLPPGSPISEVCVITVLVDKRWSTVLNCTDMCRAYCAFLFTGISTLS